MAKSAKASAKQQRIDGTYDPVPQAVADKASEYEKALKSRMRTQEKENTLRSELLELMKDHDLERIELDDERDLVLESKGERLAIKKKGQLAAAGSAE